MFNIRRFDLEAETAQESTSSTATTTVTPANDRLAKLNARLNKNKPQTISDNTKKDKDSIPTNDSKDLNKHKRDREASSKGANNNNEISYKRSREEEDARVVREEARRNKEQQAGKQRWEKRAKELKDSDLIPNDVRLAMKAEAEAKAKAEKEAKKFPFGVPAAPVAVPVDEVGQDMKDDKDEDEDHEEDQDQDQDHVEDQEDEERPALQLDGVERFADEAAADAALAELAALVPLPTFETKEITALEKERAKAMGIPDWLAHPTMIDPSDKSNRPIDDAMFGFSDRLIKQCQKAGIDECFAVQTAVIPVLMRARHLGDIRKVPGDLCVSAPTGSGKTLAYVLPIIEILSQRVVTRLRALVVLPTRDLCIQVKETFETFVKGTDLKIATSTGQNSFAHEQTMLVGESHSHSHNTPRILGGHSRVDVLITTPGRLIDHIKSTPNFTLQHLRFLVIDEADRLLNQSFQDWLYHILNAIHPSPERKFLGIDGSESIQVKRDHLGFPIHDAIAPGFLSSFFQLPESDVEDPKALSVQKLLFSATLTRNPAKIASLQLSDPQYVAVQEGGSGADGGEDKAKYTTPAGLTEHMIVCETSEKPLMVLHLLHHLKVRSALCFTKSVESAHRLYKLIQLYEKIRTTTPSSTADVVSDEEGKKKKKQSAGKDRDGTESEGSDNEESGSESEDEEDDDSSSSSDSSSDDEEDDNEESSDVEMEQAETSNDMDIDTTTPSITTDAIVVAEFSSDLSKSKRQSILKAFNNGEIHLLICSDLISRGMDLSPVSTVINYDSPVYMKKYIHRVGRTARAGKTGTAYSLIEMQEARHFKEMITKAGHWEKISRINVKPQEVKDLVGGYRRALGGLKDVLASSSRVGKKKGGAGALRRSFK
ncbi:ATP-dependent RNA helicase dbp6 [Linnemannia zychae]|nr:ATP-dependent RNA helicase dbp6 [Linnemannia zychae]